MYFALNDPITRTSSEISRTNGTLIAGETKKNEHSAVSPEFVRISIGVLRSIVKHTIMILWFINYLIVVITYALRQNNLLTYI